MVVRVATVAFEGIEARPVDVQVQIANGNVVFTVVGLGDKAVAESRESVRAALNASGLAMPAKRVTVNLAPADLPKEGSHYDLPIAPRKGNCWRAERIAVETGSTLQIPTKQATPFAHRTECSEGAE
jgi:hypothetical protein